MCLSVSLSIRDSLTIPQQCLEANGHSHIRPDHDYRHHLEEAKKLSRGHKHLKEKLRFECTLLNTQLIWRFSWIYKISLQMPDKKSGQVSNGLKLGSRRPSMALMTDSKICQ